MSTNILNLDDLTDESNAKVLRIDGVEHRAEEMTVEGYINRVKRAKRVNTDDPMDVQIEETITILSEIFPSVGDKRFHQMKLSQLGRIIEFALRAPDDIAKRAENAAAQSSEDSQDQASSGNG